MFFVEQGGSGEIHVVIGDQTSDLDSMVPVLAHAFLNDLVSLCDTLIVSAGIN